MVVLTVQPDVVELKRAARSERGGFDFEMKITNADVRFRCPPSIARVDGVCRQVVPNELLSDFTPIRIPEHSVANEWRISPNVFRRVLADDRDQQFDCVHSSPSHSLQPAIRFQNTRK